MKESGDLDGDFVFGEGTAPQKLVDAVNGEEPCDVCTEVVGHCHPDGVSGDHLQHDNTRPDTGKG